MTSRYLTVATRRALAEQTTCRHCGGAGPFDKDHKHTKWAGGGNEPGNLQHLCIPCHAIKTAKDAKERAKAKRIARKLAGTWRKPKGRPIRSRGFDKTLRRRFDGKVERRT